MGAVLNPDDVPEVQRVLEEQAALQAFKEQHADVLEQLKTLVRSYNAAVEDADKVLRAQEASCGPFTMFQCDERFDAERLFSEVGEDEFRLLGGTIHPTTEYRIDKTTLKALIAMGRIPKEVVAVVRKRIPKYHQPATYNIP